MKKVVNNIVDDMLEVKTNSFLSKEENIKKLMFLEQVQKMANKDNYGDEMIDFTAMTIKEKTPFGWMRTMAMATETMINGRWDYWLDIRTTQQVENKHIPQLNFRHGYEPECKPVTDMIKDCLKFLAWKVNGYKALELFMDWLLYGWGCSMVKVMPAEITDDINDYWYKHFKTQYMFAVPSDYFVKCASEIYGNGKFNITAFYPTPSHVVQFMVAMAYNEEDKENNKYMSVCEPCMGSGIMLLYQSNHSLRLYGQDIDPLMCKIASVNGYLYMPWLVEGDPVTDKLLSDMHKKYKSTGSSIIDAEWTDMDMDNLSHIKCTESDLELLEAL